MPPLGYNGMKAQKAIEMVEKCYPDMPVAGIARKLIAEHPSYFKEFEATRLIVRRVIGASGKALRRTHQRVAHKTELPKSYGKTPSQKRASHYHLPASLKNILVISDLHIPYHAEQEIETAIDFALERNADAIIINGDLVDNHHLSRFEKDIEKRSPAEEFAAVRQFFAYLRERFPEQPIIWTEGNHDARYNSWWRSFGAAMQKEPHFSIQSVLECEKHNITFIEDTRLVYVGKLSISHGHKILKGIFAPVNAARGVFLKTKESHLVGHTHSVSEHTEKRISGEIITTWSTGCLCELSPDYDPFVNKHTHGFAWIETGEGGKYKVENFRMYEGAIL